MHCTYLVQNLYVIYLLLSMKQNKKQIYIIILVRLGCHVWQTRTNINQCQFINMPSVIFQVYLVLNKYQIKI